MTDTREHDTREPRKRGGQPANRNNLRHGLRAGQLPPDAKYIELRLNAFRQKLEDAVIEVRGQVTLHDAAIIQTCLRWERHAALAQRWLAKAEPDELKPADRLTFSREIARASSERDKALVALDLDKKPEPVDLNAYIKGAVVDGKAKATRA